MQENVYIIRNRRIDSSDLQTIRQFIETHWAGGRTFISRQLCKHWNWFQPNGLLKDQACRALLLKLEQKGETQLPHIEKTLLFLCNANRMNRTLQSVISTTLEGRHDA